MVDLDAPLKVYLIGLTRRKAQVGRLGLILMRAPSCHEHRIFFVNSTIRTMGL